MNVARNFLGSKLASDVFGLASRVALDGGDQETMLDVMSTNWVHFEATSLEQFTWNILSSLLWRTTNLFSPLAFFWPYWKCSSIETIQLSDNVKCQLSKAFDDMQS